MDYDENEIENEILRKKLRELHLEHRDLDDVISHLAENISDFDQLKLRRLKKRKLNLKDQISVLESKLIPDLNA